MINGILNIRKEKGYTSHDVVARLRGITHQKKIGHTGTLDPDAEGVLPVCLGRATKVCDLLTERDKTYEAMLLLGVETDTQDITGTVLRTGSADVSEEEALDCIAGFVGDYDQIPPMYSALKVGGKKLCDLAREGKTVERKSRRVTIHNIRILSVELPRVRMEVSCSKGTYIRTLCHDIGQKLGTGGCMESLVRTRSGMFCIRDSVTLREVEAAVKAGTLGEMLIPLDRVFSGLKAGMAGEALAHCAYNGNPLPADRVEFWEEPPGPGEECRIYDGRGRFVGIYRHDAGEGKLRLKKMFFDPAQGQEDAGI